MKLQVFVLLLLLFVLFCFSVTFYLSYSSVPAVRLITAEYIAAVITRECVCVTEAGE